MAGYSTAVRGLAPRRVHILGLGSIGTLVAHSLKSLPDPPPISLLLHRKALWDEFVAEGSYIRLEDEASGIVHSHSGFDVDRLDGIADQPSFPASAQPKWTFIPHNTLEGHKNTNRDTRPFSEPSNTPTGEAHISSLIVTVKGPATAQAVRSVRHRLDARSTICLLQNGMGQIDELNSLVFSDPATRPTYLVGIVFHGAHMRRPFNVVHAGRGNVILGAYRDLDRFPVSDADNTQRAAATQPEPIDAALLSRSPSAAFLLDTLQAATLLRASVLPHGEVLRRQLEKLAANCVVNPLTALLDVRNGALLTCGPLGPVRKALVAEIASVFAALPELRGAAAGVDANNDARRSDPAKGVGDDDDGHSNNLSAAALEARLEDLARTTAQNSSSMREDVRAGRDTEVDYINGYVVSRGRKLGLDVRLNELLMQMVRARTVLDRPG